MATVKKAPVTRLGWFQYYTRRAGEILESQAAHLALWYWFLHLEHDANIDPDLILEA